MRRICTNQIAFRPELFNSVWYGTKCMDRVRTPLWLGVMIFTLQTPLNQFRPYTVPRASDDDPPTQHGRLLTSREEWF